MIQESSGFLLSNLRSEG